MAMEFWRSQEPGDIAIKLTPADSGRLEVHLDGDKIFDRADEGGKYPDLTRVKELRAAIRERLAEPVAADD